jgi:hypothetical protein
VNRGAAIVGDTVGDAAGNGKGNRSPIVNLSAGLGTQSLLRSNAWRRRRPTA